MNPTPSPSTGDMRKLLERLEKNAEWIKEPPKGRESYKQYTVTMDEVNSLVRYCRSLEEDLAFHKGERARGNSVLVPADKLKEMQDRLRSLEADQKKLRIAVDALEDIEAERACLSMGKKGAHCGCASDAFGKKRLAENALSRIRSLSPND